MDGDKENHIANAVINRCNEMMMDTCHYFGVAEHDIGKLAIEANLAALRLREALHKKIAR